MDTSFSKGFISVLLQYKTKLNNIKIRFLLRYIHYLNIYIFVYLLKDQHMFCIIFENICCKRNCIAFQIRTKFYYKVQ